VDADEICPHWPWGETDLVENYRTLGDAAGFLPDTARRHWTDTRAPGPNSYCTDRSARERVQVGDEVDPVDQLASACG
jgi:hypothetical protein